MLARTFLIAPLVVGCFACADKPPEPKAAPRLVLPAGGGTRPFPATACRTGDQEPQVLACVDGVAITRAAYDRVVDSYPVGTQPAAIVRALIDAEILARAAAAKGMWSAWLVAEYRRALAGRYVEKRFEQDYGWQQVHPQDLKTAWANWRVRSRYQHHPTWFATDAQFLCCTGDPRNCSIREEVSKCIDELEPQAIALHAELAKHPPRGPLEMKGRTYALGHRFPRAAIADVNFEYDPSVPWADQVGRGYTVMVEPYAEAVTKLKVGELSAPIRTPFGWHITRLNNYEAPATKDLNDPEVRREIATNVLPMVRKRDVQAHAYQLMSERGVKVQWPKSGPAGT